MLEPVSGHGLCPTDLSPEPSRHRSLFAAQRSKLYHCGFKSPVRRSTLADANERRDWRIYADFARTLIDIARPLYADSDLGLDLEATVYALDATTIDLCLSVFPWANYKRPREPSSFTRCWKFTVLFPSLSTSLTPMSTTFTCSMCSFPSPALL